MTQEPSKHTVRIWLLMLLAASGRTGLPSVEKSKLHSLLFLSNCLAPIYNSHGPNHLVMKYARGPFYPNAQWDIDRLVVQGYIDVHSVRHIVDADGHWTTAEYSISKQGFELVQTVVKLSTVEPIWEFMKDLGAAFSNLKIETRERSVLKDVTYDQPGMSERAVINFSDEMRNYSVRAANTFVELAPHMLKPGRQDRLRMYLKYLERRAA